jgi:hypothetical protein
MSPVKEAPMHRLVLIGLALTLPFIVVAAPAAPSTDAKQEIQRIVDTFQTAIIAKDGKTLSNLFLPKGGAWFTVLSDESYARIKAKEPTAPRFKQGTYTDFVDFVAASKEPVQETFSNVRIDTDGAVASVYFDFVFLANHVENNRGSEAWHLIKTNDGWKISSMIYSANLGDKD